jgi:hypothetical protein
MGLFDETATLTAGQDPGDTSTSGLGGLISRSNLYNKAVAEGTINPNNVSLQDFESFVVTNPDIVDPSIDLSGLKTTTDANILGNITDFPGIQYEAYNPNRLSDLMRLYSSGLPTLATDTAQIPGAVDTLVDVGGGGGQDQATGDSVAGFDPGVTPGPSGFIGLDPDMDIDPQDFAQEDYGIYDPTATTGGITGDPIEVGIPDNESGFVDPLGTIGGAPVVGNFSEPTTIQGDLSQVQVDGGLSAIDEERLAGYTPSFETPEQQQGFLQDVLGRAGQTVDNALTELGKVPGAVVDFANQTVDIFGQKINVGKTLLGAGINKIVGGPVSLIFDLLPSEDPTNTLTRNIVDELKAEKNYGFNIQSGNLNQDPFGRNPVSAFGNYEQTLLDDATSTNTTKMGLAKKEFAQDYFDKKAGKTAPQEDIGSVPGDVTTGADPITGDLPGGGNIVDEFDTTPFTGPTMADVAGDGGQDTGPSGPPSGPGEASADAGFAGEGSGAQGPAGGASNAAAAAAQDAARGSYGGPPSQSGGGGGGSSGGGGKIVCTMMNESYGFGSFRNKIWLRHSKNLAPEYQKGYHKIFLPLVKLSKKNIVLKKILEHIAVHRTIDIRQESRGKVHLLGRVYRKILEPICYWVGKHD